MKCSHCKKTFKPKQTRNTVCSLKCQYSIAYLNQKKKFGMPYLSERTRARRIRRVLGITQEEYNNVMEKNADGCALCKHKPKPPQRSLSIDHCHKSGKVRGLLCGKCNGRGLGFVESVGLKAVADYLGYEIKEKGYVC